MIIKHAVDEGMVPQIYKRTFMTLFKKLTQIE